MSEYSDNAFARSIVRYTGGRVVNAVAGILILIWIARQLPEVEYAAYITAFALLEIGLVVSTIGMDWVTAVFIPQVKLNSSGSALEKFVWRCTAVQVASLAVGSLTWFFLAPGMARWLGSPEAVTAFRLYAAVMLVEGVSRVLRDQLMSCLLLHGAAQVSQMARNVVLLSLILWLFQDGQERTVETLAIAELIASAASLLPAAALVYLHLARRRHQLATDPAWGLPHIGQMLRIGSNAWFSSLANMTWGGQVVILLATRLVGFEAAAPLGFGRNLSEQVRKYMPMEFFFGLARTLMIARYSVERDSRRLGARAGAMYKGNLLFLLPLLAVGIVLGDEACSYLSNGRYESAHWILVGWMAVLLVSSHRRLTDLLAHTLDHPFLTGQATALLVVTPAVLALILPLQHWALLFTVLLIAELFYSGMVLLRLNAAVHAYSPDWTGLCKYAIALGGAYAALWIVPFGSGVTGLVGAALTSFAVVWSALYFLQAWSEEELGILPANVLRWGRRIT